MLLAGLQPAEWAVAVFLLLLGVPMIYSCYQVIRQTRIAPGVQGRVFSARRLVALSTPPLAYPIAGPLAEHVFEPALAPGGPLSGTLGRMVGTGEGRGIALLFAVLGCLLIWVVVRAWRNRQLRLLDDIPDFSDSGREPERS